MTVATNTATYGSLVFEGIGNHYVLIALAFFPAGHPRPGWGLTGSSAGWKKARIERYAQKMDGTGGFPSFRPSTDKGCGTRPLRLPHPLFPGIGLRRVLLFAEKNGMMRGRCGLLCPRRKRAEVRYGTQSEL